MVIFIFCATAWQECQFFLYFYTAHWVQIIHNNNNRGHEMINNDNGYHEPQKVGMYSVIKNDRKSYRNNNIYIPVPDSDVHSRTPFSSLPISSKTSSWLLILWMLTLWFIRLLYIRNPRVQSPTSQKNAQCSSSKWSRLSAAVLNASPQLLHG